MKRWEITTFSRWLRSHRQRRHVQHEASWGANRCRKRQRQRRSGETVENADVRRGMIPYTRRALGGGGDYDFRRTYSIIRCRGCETISFRDHFVDLENAYPISQDEWEVPETTEYYPRRPSAAKEVETFLLPGVVAEIYKETLLSIDEGALTLASLGLRGTIEAVCNDLQVKGRSLEARISKLATMGVISAKDAERLHAIRFLGNDAAHEIKKPKKAQVDVALKIVIHLIRSVYILETQATGSLDTIVTRPEDFKALLDKHLKDLSTGDEYPLAAILGKDMRRLGGGASGLEAQLMAEIAAATYTALTIGKVAPFQGSAGPVQHFIVS